MIPYTCISLASIFCDLILDQNEKTKTKVFKSNTWHNSSICLPSKKSVSVFVNMTRAAQR